MTRFAALACAALLAGCAVHPPSGDEALDPLAAAFLPVPSAIPDLDSAAIGILGLGAPSGADFMEFGRSAARRQRADDYSAPAAARLEWDRERMNCWSEDYEPFDKDANCAPFEEAARTVRERSELLARYRHVETLPPPNDDTFYPGTRFLAMTRLNAISMKVDWKEGRYEEAYGTWVGQHAFIQRMCASTRGTVEMAVCLVAEGLSEMAIESLLFHAPGLIDTHAGELMRVLAPGPLARYNMEGMLRREHAHLLAYVAKADNHEMLMPNYIANRHYLFARQLLDAMAQPSSATIDEACKCLDRRDLESGDPRVAASAQLVMARIPTFLVRSMHSKNRVLSMLNARIRIATEKIPEAGIAAFVASMNETLRDSLAGAQMDWDPARRVLLLHDPANFGPMEVRIP
jgi:hypothetical protein